MYCFCPPTWQQWHNMKMLYSHIKAFPGQSHIFTCGLCVERYMYVIFTEQRHWPHARLCMCVCLYVRAYLYGGRDTRVPMSPGHSGRVRICMQTAFDRKTCVYMTCGKTALGSRVTQVVLITRFARPRYPTTQVTVPPKMSEKVPYKHFRPGRLSAMLLWACTVVCCCFVMAWST